MAFSSIIHNDPTITTIAALIASNEMFSKLTPQQLLEVRIEGQTNYQRLQRRYDYKEVRVNDNKFNSGQYGAIQIKLGSELFIANETIIRETLHKQEPTVVQITEAKPFLSSALNKLLRDPNYTKVNTLTDGSAIQQMFNEIAVYMWIRSLTAFGEPSQGTWVDVTPFVENISTTKGPDAGTFDIVFAGVKGVIDENRGWVFDKDSLKGFSSDHIAVNFVNYPQKKGDGFNRENFFFEHALQRNDIVYIRFERLGTDRSNPALQFELSPSEMTKSTWDMIGLIDSVSQLTTPSSVQIAVSGRDLTKILIDDGSYFFPEQFAGQIFKEKGLLADRNKVEATLNVLNVYTYKTIETSLKFIWNKFSSIGLVPDSVFSGYGDGAVKDKFSLQQTVAKKTGQTDIISLVDPFLGEKRRGVWQIFDLVFDKESAQRVLADNSVSQEQGSIINSIRKFCQDPFVEFHTDTYGDRFVAVIRKPPFDAKGYKGLVYDNPQYEIEVQDIEGGEDVTATIHTRLSDLVMDIDDSEVISDAFDYHNEAFSWYQLTPQGLLRGASQITTFAFIPLIAFDEYAEVFGSRPLSVVSNYVPFEYIDDEARKARQNFVEAQAFLDLQFMIQSTQYIPFARRGTITLVGNRTIKRGLFIRYKPTNEIFYVDSVSHDRSIGVSNNDRTTTISVSRGLREPFVFGVDIEFGNETKKVSYFDIINTEIGENPSINNNKFLKNWKVDKDIFNFFLHRRQWDQKYDR